MVSEMFGSYFPDRIPRVIAIFIYLSEGEVVGGQLKKGVVVVSKWSPCSVGVLVV